MSKESITVEATVNADRSTTWHYYTESEHVINWNFASEDWHCPQAINDLREGGDFKITMAAKDGSMSFDMEGTYDEITPEKHIAYTLSNGRKVTVNFNGDGDGTRVDVTFDPEEGEDRDTQRKGWQAILDNFRKYTNAEVAQ